MHGEIGRVEIHLIDRRRIRRVGVDSPDTAVGEEAIGDSDRDACPPHLLGLRPQQLRDHLEEHSLRLGDSLELRAVGLATFTEPLVEPLQQRNEITHLDPYSQ